MWPGRHEFRRGHKRRPNRWSIALLLDVGLFAAVLSKSGRVLRALIRLAAEVVSLVGLQTVGARVRHRLVLIAGKLVGIGEIVVGVGRKNGRGGQVAVLVGSVGGSDARGRCGAGARRSGLVGCGQNSVGVLGVLDVVGGGRLALSPEAARPPSERALFEHELAVGVNGPVVSLAGLAHGLGQLDEALVQAEVVAHRVLPALVLALEKREVCLQILVDFVEGHFFAGRILDGHDYERYVGERRLLVLLLAALHIRVGRLLVAVLFFVRNHGRRLGRRRRPARYARRPGNGRR
ncbi:hypothetical protein BpHYR1_002766 [Brachionus plicatilis]|uniref:Uncharacterized protein n=1 Tax=Brachionus plicatilis TaxID=10195 RepID=A0A3M7SZG1_BRAPC|nr:hypothetical protein BpHYR1_002766 [Brachionus plicatilis]